MAEDVSKRAYALGFEYERDKGNCAQCVFAAVQEVLGERNDDIFKAANGFAGGSGRMGTGNCGAYSGGILVISSKFGRSRQEFNERKSRQQQTNEVVEFNGKQIPKGFSLRDVLVRELHDKFVEEYGSVICNDIRQKLFGRTFDEWNPTDKEEFEKAGAHHVPPYHCPTVVGKAAQWTTEILLKAEKF